MAATIIEAPPMLPLLATSARIPASPQPFDMAGEISHRLIVNYRISHAAFSAFDIAPFEWDLYEHTAFLSVCLLRYTRLGPSWWPSALAHRGSCDALFRLAVRAEVGGRPIRGFLSLLNLNSSRLLAFSGRRIAPHKFAYAPLRLSTQGMQLSVDGLDIAFRADLSRANYTPPASSIFSSLHDAETFLLDLAGNVSLPDNGPPLLQPISHSPWRSAFLEPSEMHFALLAPWVEAGTLELDSVLYMSDLRQVWQRTRPLAAS